MLKEMREKAGLSQSQLATKSEVSIRMIQQWEQGVKNINAAHLLSLVNLSLALECNISDILTDQELIDKMKKFN